MSTLQNILFSLTRFTEPDSKEISPALNDQLVRALATLRFVDGMNEHLIGALKEQPELEFPKEINFEEMETYFEYDVKDGYYKWFSPLKNLLDTNELPTGESLNFSQFFFKYFENILKNKLPVKPDAVELSHVFAYEQAAKQLYNFHPKDYVRWTLEQYPNFEFSRFKNKALSVLLNGLKLKSAYTIDKSLQTGIHIKAAQVIKTFNYEDALNHYYKALELTNETSTSQLSSENETLVTNKSETLFGLGTLSEEAGFYTKSLQFLNECIQYLKGKNYSTEIPRLQLLFYQGKYAISEYFSIQSIKNSGTPETQNEETTDQISAKANQLRVLSRIYFHQGRYAAAEAISKAVIKATVDDFGSTHDIVTDLIIRLAYSLLCQNKFEEGLKYISQIGQAIQARRFERFNAALVMSLEAYLFYMTGAIDEKNVLEIVETSIRNSLVKTNRLNRITIDCYILLARILMQSENTQPAAVQILVKCLHFYESRLGRPYHPAQKMVLELLLSKQEASRMGIKAAFYKKHTTYQYTAQVQYL